MILCLSFRVSVLHSVPLYSYFSFGMGKFICVIEYWKYLTFFFIVFIVTANGLPRVSKDTLDLEFSTMVKM